MRPNVQTTQVSKGANRSTRFYQSTGASLVAAAGGTWPAFAQQGGGTHLLKGVVVLSFDRVSAISTKPTF